MKKSKSFIVFQTVKKHNFWNYATITSKRLLCEEIFIFFFFTRNKTIKVIQKLRNCKIDFVSCANETKNKNETEKCKIEVKKSFSQVAFSCVIFIQIAVAKAKESKVKREEIATIRFEKEKNKIFRAKSELNWNWMNENVSRALGPNCCFCC